MRILITILFSLFLLKSQAQDKAKNMAEARAKMQALMSKMQQNPSKTEGKITYTVNGKTYSVTNGISTVIINGKIGDISDSAHTVSIGDGNVHAFKVGQSYDCKGLTVMVDGVQYARRSKDNIATITFYNGKSMKGSFSGTVYNEQSKKTLPVSGTFELSNITKI